MGPGGDLDFVFTSGEDTDLLRLLNNLSSTSGEDPDVLPLGGVSDFLLEDGDEPERLLLEAILDFSSIAEEPSVLLAGLCNEPDLLLEDALDLFFTTGGDLDWLRLEGDLDFFFDVGEERDLLRLGDNLDFFLRLGEELERLRRGGVCDFFFLDLGDEPE